VFFFVHIKSSALSGAVTVVVVSVVVVEAAVLAVVLAVGVVIFLIMNGRFISSVLITPITCPSKFEDPSIKPGSDSLNLWALGCVSIKIIVLSPSVDVSMHFPIISCHGRR
jgi:hypothetical protein